MTPKADSYSRKRARQARARRARRKPCIVVPAPSRAAASGHVYTHAACDACGRRWATTTQGEIRPTEDGRGGFADGPDPLDSDWYTRLTDDGIVPVAICPAPCGALVYLQPSQWVRRPRGEYPLPLRPYTPGESR